MKYDGNNQLFIARFEGGVWKRMRLIRWNCRWHIQGWDSRPTELDIDTPTVAEDGKIAFGYNHIRERKSRVLIDGKSLQPVGTREASDQVSAQRLRSRVCGYIRFCATITYCAGRRRRQTTTASLRRFRRLRSWCSIKFVKIQNRPK